MADGRRGLTAEAAYAVRSYRVIAGGWVRSSFAYPVSFWMLTVGALAVNGLDFVGVWFMFHTIDSLGGFSLREIGLLYGATSIAIGVGDLLIGSVEQLGVKIRTGQLDAMMTRPVPLLVQVCADQFQLRRLGRISQAMIVFAWAAPIVDWDPARVLVAVMMLCCGGAIFFALFVGFSALQFWAGDANEVANAFTYGGDTINQYPLTIYPKELARSLTYVLPLAFVNWYPCLFLLGRSDPFGAPDWLRFASPLAAAWLLVLMSLIWRAGVRHYRSTGS
ncbi:MAG: ABC transporter permease [Nocardioides sp.]|uniref:ABC transporter permease n=1 Tax=Nocardioides sp. TaxID=35761 RepID=UPI0039E352B9